MNSASCRTRAADRIGDERHRDPAAADGLYPFAEWGYVYSTRADALDLPVENSIYFSFDSWVYEPGSAEYLDAQLMAARLFCHRCDQAGLTVVWDGLAETRILLRDLNWRLRLPA